MSHARRPVRRALEPRAEPCEDRILLNAARVARPLLVPGYLHPVRSNAPVLPFESAPVRATFLDPTVQVRDGLRVSVGRSTYVAPYAVLNGTDGFVTVGNGSIIQDNAKLLGNPDGIASNLAGVVVGDVTVIGHGAVVRGPSAVGARGTTLGTYVGPNALIDGAVIEAGAYVSPLARVGPGVTVPAGIRVLPGVNVTSIAEASEPALGKVAPLTAADREEVVRTLSNGPTLATGYTNLYQGNSVTGTTNEQAPRGVFNGNLAAVLGVSAEPTGKTPTFTIGNRRIAGTQPGPRPRIIGGAVFGDSLRGIVHRLGRSNVIRADEGQPITIGSIARAGNGLTIHAPRGDRLTVGNSLLVGRGVVLLGGATAVIGDRVTIGNGAVVSRSSIGSGAIIGAKSYVAGSTVAAGTVIPPGTILVENQVVGTVQW
jgi:carbonic anhydrase/acetyltransferase-like protein (isoleucine patch superfamily)